MTMIVPCLINLESRTGNRIATHCSTVKKWLVEVVETFSIVRSGPVLGYPSSFRRQLEKRRLKETHQLPMFEHYQRS